MKIYLVKQTHPNDNYHNETIYVCSTKEKAQEYCRKLNKQYGRGCTFDENWDYVDDNGFYNNVHYYDWECMDLDKPLA